MERQAYNGRYINQGRTKCTKLKLQRACLRTPKTHSSSQQGAITGNSNGGKLDGVVNPKSFPYIPKSFLNSFYPRNPIGYFTRPLSWFCPPCSPCFSFTEIARIIYFLLIQNFFNIGRYLTMATWTKLTYPTFIQNSLCYSIHEGRSILFSGLT
ncbi:hypothetical protein RchiOBHm_Chr1g0323661 [Rosa chinensis]|uniref:Uncharacterized protein n=1 Tax=Rosa chinensis TaxID=74649 RepID=A0A2P6S9I5_ROSCH|nr:hypothetical protein RchiOBHm_Chr1g0323661 [Rosa chinensis]